MFLLIISGVSFAAWLWIAFFRMRIQTPIAILETARSLTEAPEIVALIPARDEAQTIAVVVSSLLLSEYPGALTVVLVDDHSTDGTAEIAWRAASDINTPIVQRANLESREFYSKFADNRAFAVKQAPPLPAGWTGKLWALNAGLAKADELAPNARYVLFLDADILIAPSTLASLVAHAERERLSLVSLMARLDARGAWAGLLIPAFVFFFQKLYPFHCANSRGDRLAAAAGGCMLLRREALNAIDGVNSIRDRLIDDCALAAAVKETSRHIWLGLADDEVMSLRDNRSLGSIWSMVERTAFTQLRRSIFLLGLTIVGMALLYLAAPFILLTAPLHGNFIASLIAALAWGLSALSFWPTAQLYHRTPLECFLLPAAATFYWGMTISSASKHLSGAGGGWKGRTYASAQTQER